MATHAYQGSNEPVSLDQLYSRSYSSTLLPSNMERSVVSQAWPCSNEQGNVNTAENDSYHWNSLAKGLNLVDQGCQCSLDDLEFKGHFVTKMRVSHEAVPPTFDGENKSIIDFVDDFLRVCQYNQWSEKECLFHLWNSIVGNAKICVQTMPYPSKLETFLKELLAFFYCERRVEVYRDQFAKVERDISMDLETYAYYLLGLVRKAFPSTLPVEQERMARECFFRTAGSNDLQVWLKAFNPKTLKDTIDLACQFEEAVAASKRISQNECLPMQDILQLNDSHLTIEEKLQSLAGELKDLNDLMKLESIQPCEAGFCNTIDCSQSQQSVQQMQSLIAEVKALTEKVHSLAVPVESPLSSETDGAIASTCWVSGQEKPFVCSLCNRAFRAKRNLKAHVETTHAPSFEGYECPKDGCPRTFHPVHRGLMKAHLKAGHGCTVGEVKMLVENAQRTVVVNSSSTDNQKVSIAHLGCEDLQRTTVGSKPKGRRSRGRGRRKLYSISQLPNSHCHEVAAAIVGSVGFPKHSEESSSSPGSSPGSQWIQEVSEPSENVGSDTDCSLGSQWIQGDSELAEKSGTGTDCAPGSPWIQETHHSSLEDTCSPGSKWIQETLSSLESFSPGSQWIKDTLRSLEREG